MILVRGNSYINSGIALILFDLFNGSVYLAPNRAPISIEDIPGISPLYCNLVLKPLLKVTLFGLNRRSSCSKYDDIKLATRNPTVADIFGINV